MVLIHGDACIVVAGVVGRGWGSICWEWTRYSLLGAGKVTIRHIHCVPAKWTEFAGRSCFLRGHAVKKSRIYVPAMCGNPFNC